MGREFLGYIWGYLGYGFQLEGRQFIRVFLLNDFEILGLRICVFIDKDLKY